MKFKDIRTIEKRNLIDKINLQHFSIKKAQKDTKIKTRL